MSFGVYAGIIFHWKPIFGELNLSWEVRLWRKSIVVFIYLLEERGAKHTPKHTRKTNFPVRERQTKTHP